MTGTVLSIGLGALLILQSADTDSATPKPPEVKSVQVRPVQPRDAKEPTYRRQLVLRAAVAKRETIVVHLKHLPAVDAAKAITEWLEKEQRATDRAPATVVAEVVSNSLVLSGSAEQLKAIRDVIVALDRPSPRIRVKAMLFDLALPTAPKDAADNAATSVPKGDFAEIMAELKKRGDLRVLAQPELLAVSNQPAMLQLGGRVPRITASQQSSRGRINQVSMESMGTILGVTGRVAEDDLVTLEIDLEHSYLGPESEGTPLSTPTDGPAIRAAEVKTLTLKTTVSLRSGKTVLLGGMQYQREERRGEVLLLLKPEIVPICD